MREILEQARSPSLWLSFGKDSLLLLKLALAAGFDGPCYFFGDKLTQLAQQTIIDNDLTVYSWPATNRYVVPSGNGWAQVDEYLIENTMVPMLSPIVRGENCDHMQFRSRFTKQMRYPHDVTLTGYKRGDWNAAAGVTFPRELDISVTRLVHPLYDWTDAQVVDALGFAPPDENAVGYCDDCLAFINSTDWDRDAALVNFRRRFNFH